MKATNDTRLQVSLDAYLDTVKDIEKYSEAPMIDHNPFISNLKDVMTVKHKVQHAINGYSSMEIIDKESGEVVSDISENRVFTKKQYVDTDKFIKIYTNRFKELFDLSGSAMKVFGFIMNELQKPENKDRDMIYFDIKDCMLYLNFSQANMVYKGLTELIQHGFIAKAEKSGHIYIDSKTAFNGSRIVIMEQYERKDKDFFDNGQKRLPNR